MAITSERSKPRCLDQRSRAWPFEQPAFKMSTMDRFGIVLRPQNGEVGGKSQATSRCCALHQLNWPAKHGLDGVFGQRFIDGADVLDIRCILFHPSLDDPVKLLMVFADDGARAFAVEGQHHVVAELAHVMLIRRAVACGSRSLWKHLSARRTGDRAIRADKPQIEAQRFGDG